MTPAAIRSRDSMAAPIARVDPRPNALFAEFGDDVPFRFTVGQFFRVSLAVAIRQRCFSQQMVHRVLMEQQDFGLLGFLSETTRGRYCWPDESTWGHQKNGVLFSGIPGSTRRNQLPPEPCFRSRTTTVSKFGKMLTLLIQIICWCPISSEDDALKKSTGRRILSPRSRSSSSIFWEAARCAAQVSTSDLVAE